MILDIQQFVAQGYMHYPAALSATEVDAVRSEMCIRVQAHAAKNTQVLLPTGEAKTLPVELTNSADMLLIERGASILRQFPNSEFADLKYIAGAVIPKYFNEGRRPWHVDWWDWTAPETDRQIAPQAGVIFYLDSTTEISGALSVIPGSHIHRSPAHQSAFESTGKYWAEETIPVTAGDTIIIDARILHAVTGNYFNHTRIAATMWYLIGWDGLSEEVKAGTRPCMNPSFRTLLGNLYPEYTGNLLPKPHVKIPRFQ